MFDLKETLASERRREEKRKEIREQVIKERWVAKGTGSRKNISIPKKSMKEAWEIMGIS